jgi:hypothetical protein
MKGHKIQGHNTASAYHQNLMYLRLEALLLHKKTRQLGPGICTIVHPNF